LSVTGDDAWTSASRTALAYGRTDDTTRRGDLNVETIRDGHLRQHDLKTLTNQL
jgi:hypothetical protein